MKVLFDHNVPKKLRSLLPGHSIKTSREMGWEAPKEWRSAGRRGGERLLSHGDVDKNLCYQQNLEGRKLALVVLPTTDWGTLRMIPAPISAALDEATPGSFQALPG